MYGTISSKTNEKVKTVKKLADKKYRAEYGLFVIEGHKLVGEFNKSGGTFKQIFTTDEAKNKYSQLLESIECTERYIVPRDIYEYMSTEQAPQGILAVCAKPDTNGEFKKGNALILESVRDAGNLGTIIRTAVAFGIETIVMSADCADIYNPKTLRASMGSVFYANIYISRDVCELAEKLVSDGRKVYASMLSDDAVEISDVKFEDDACVVVGNEGNGISEELARRCTTKIIIPMKPCAESLNASIAAAILMWELIKGGTK